MPNIAGAFSDLSPVRKQFQRSFCKYVQESFRNTFKINNPIHWITGIVELDGSTTSNVVGGLDVCNFRRGAVFKSLLVKTSIESFDTGINATKHEILRENVGTFTVQLTPSSVALNTLLYTFDK